MRERTIIDRYEPRPAICREYDPRVVDVARRVTVLIESRLNNVTVEHVGSTSVPGCAGKGIIDLMLVYPLGELASARDVLDELGFQRQSTRSPFPEERPMRVGSVKYDGTRFLVHVHVIAVSSGEVTKMRDFRERLRNDTELMRRYVASKQAIIESGTTDLVDYAIRKGSFVRQTLGG